MKNLWAIVRGLYPDLNIGWQQKYWMGTREETWGSGGLDPEKLFKVTPSRSLEKAFSNPASRINANKIAIQIHCWSYTSCKDLKLLLETTNVAYFLGQRGSTG